eukprot:725522_1
MPVRLNAKQQRTTINKSLKKNNRGGSRTKKKRGRKRSRSPSISRLNEPRNKRRQRRKYKHQYYEQKTKGINNNRFMINTKRTKKLNKNKKHQTNAAYYAQNGDKIKETYHQNKPKKQYNPYSKRYDVGNFEINVDWDDYRCDVPYYQIGDQDQECEFCGAKFWSDERLNYKKCFKPRFGSKCCNSGKINIPLPRELPPYLESLFFGEPYRIQRQEITFKYSNTMNTYTHKQTALVPSNQII